MTRRRRGPRRPTCNECGQPVMWAEERFADDTAMRRPLDPVLVTTGTRYLYLPHGTGASAQRIGPAETLPGHPDHRDVCRARRRELPMADPRVGPDT